MSTISGADASDLAVVIQDLVRSASAPNTEQVKVMVDPRTNSLLVMASPGSMPEVKNLIARLDVEMPAGG